jgi:hypothetical protein
LLLTTIVINNVQRTKVKRNNWEVDAGYETPKVRSLLEVFLGAVFIARAPIPGTNFNFGDFAAFLLVMLGIFRTPYLMAKVNRAYAVTFSLLMAFLIVESFYNGEDFLKRSLRLSILAALAGCIASRRLDVVQLFKGFGIALVLNVPLYYLHIAPDLYKGCFTGFLMDKNVAGMFYASMSIALMALVNKTSYRVMMALAGGVLVYLTLSRTSLVAFAFGIIWLAIAKRAGITSRIVFAGLASVAYVFLQDQFAHFGVFADRLGTDALRARIDAAMAAKVAITPWYGQGLSTATVEVGPYTFFYHNSYLALITEGGWIFLAVVLGGFALVTLRFLSSPPFTRSEIYMQGAGVVMMLCATRLGEVFMTIPTFVLLGASMQLMAIDQEKKAALGVVAKPKNRIEPKKGRIRA